MEPGRARTLTLVATILGSTIAFVDSTVVNVALPDIRRDLGTDLAEQQWVVEAYLLTLGALLLIGGSLGDLLGRRRIFTIGVAGFGVASLLCAIAPEPLSLILARAGQGAFGALLIPSSLAILAAAYPPDERGKAVGLWTAWTSAAIAMGPPLGGALVDATSWRVVFFLNVPLIAICLVLIARAMPEFPGQRSRHVDFPGAVLCAVGLGGPVFALIEQPRAGWSAPEVAIPLVGGLAALAAFFVYEARYAKDPMLPLGLFRSRAFSVVNGVTFLVYAALGAVTFFAAIFLQQLGGYTALASGLAFLPLSLLLVLGSPHAGALAARLGPRLFLGLGPIIAAGGMVLLAMVDADPSYATEVFPGVVLFGIGLAMTVAPLTSTVLQCVDESNAGVASGVNNAIARVAGLLAIAAVGAVVAAQATGVLDDRARDAPPSEQRQLADARERTLSAPPRGASREVADAIEDAGVRGFRVGLITGAILCASGGVLALVALRPPTAPVKVQSA